MFLKVQNIDFPIILISLNVASLNGHNNLWCKRENVESGALKEWKIKETSSVTMNIFEKNLFFLNHL